MTIPMGTYGSFPQEPRHLDPGGVISLRDANERCRLVESVDEMLAVVLSASRSGDRLLIDAALTECDQRGWGSEYPYRGINGYVDATTDSPT